MVADAIGASIFSGEVLLLTIVDMTDSATGASTLTAGAIFSTELLSSALAASTMTVGVLVPASMISAATGATTLELQATLLASMFSYAAGNSVVPVDGTGQAAWAINTETNASTRYEGYAFNSFARIGDSYYGAKSDGIHRLEGDTDNGEPIQAMVSFGRQDFGTTAKKRITNAYVGASSAGRLFMRITADGQDYTYAARSSSEQLREQRFDVGRGLSANLLEFELYNADGDDFELASVEFAAVALTRRI